MPELAVAARFVDQAGTERLDGTLYTTAVGLPVVRGPFSFTFATAGLTAGVTVYTPAVSDVLLDAWIEVTTAFDGTTPKADIGTFVGTNNGLFGLDAVVDLTAADVQTQGTGVLFGVTFSDLALIGADANQRIAPARFTAANPLKLVVSQTGAKSGTATGATAGAGRVYLVTATPVAL